jgi:hypothetical protein
MHRPGAHCFVRAMKRGNARGAKGAGHPRRDGVNGQPEELLCLDGRRQPSLGGTSRMNREVHVRICGRLGAKFPGPTRQHPGPTLPFRPRSSTNRTGKFFINFSPAVSNKATKAIRDPFRSWKLPQRSDQAIEDLSRMFNPMIRGWLQSYGRYYRSALYPTMRELDRDLVLWAKRKYKKLRSHLRRATHWIARISRRAPERFAHWQMGARHGSMMGAV